jgi:platelet-activating factor acetylhydrolase IB subunit alpha
VACAIHYPKIALCLLDLRTVGSTCSCAETFQIWDHESGDYIRTLKGHTNTVNSVAFAPTGSHLVSCSTDLSIKLWDFSSYACLRTLRGHDHTISAVLFIPKLGLSANESTSTGIDPSVAGAQQLLTASRDMTVKLWDVETGFCDQTFTDHNDWVRCLAVRASNGSLWASSGNDQVIYVYEHKQKVVELRGHEHVVESIAFLTEEPLKVPVANKQTDLARDYLVSGSRDRTVRLWRISEATCVFSFTAHENWVRGVILHPSGNFILSCSDDKSIRVFDIKNQRCLRTLADAHAHFCTSLSMHPTLPILVSASVDQTLRCWFLQ